MVVARRGADRRLRAGVVRARGFRAQPPGHLQPPALVAAQRFSYAGTVPDRAPRRRVAARRHRRVKDMAIVPLLDDASASPEARAVFDDIRKTRDTDYINNFWRALANDPAT